MIYIYIYNSKRSISMHKLACDANVVLSVQGYSHNYNIWHLHSFSIDQSQTLCVGNSSVINIYILRPK